jgi:DNA modification methylase
MLLNTCHVGDCRDLLKQMATAGVRVQMCVTSPPYFGLRDYGAQRQIGLEPTPGEYVDEMVAVFSAVRDVLADDGTLWLNLGDSYAGVRGYQVSQTKHRTHQYGQANRAKSLPDGFKAKDLMGIPWRVAFALQADGWYLRSDIIWHKPNPMPESVTDRPTKAHEYLFLLAKSERYYYDAAAIKEQCSDNSHGSPNINPGWKQQDRNQSGSLGKWTDEDKELGRNKRSVWSVATMPFDGAHFAVFPRTLIEPCILAGSRPGDVVLDPFMGSGTTAQVAEHLGRQWIGCELNPDYMPLQAKRLQQRAMAF